MLSAGNRNIRYNCREAKSTGKQEIEKGLMENEQGTPANHDWKVRRVGTVTFAISKPKRNPRKMRQMRLKNRRRAR
jgi:hypothetical protein